MQPREELALRWRRVQSIMQTKGVEAMLISDNSSIYYLAGRIFAGVVYITMEGEPLFFLRRPVGITEEGFVYIRKVEDIPEKLLERGLKLPASIALEGDVVSYNEYARQARIFALPQERVSPIATSIVKSARSVKTPYEISQARLSGLKHSQLYSMIPSIFERGMSDNDLSRELDRESRRLGGVGYMRIAGRTMEGGSGSSLLVGANADTPSPYDFALGGEGIDPTLPMGCNGTPITEGVTIMVDSGGMFTSYITDMTRVFTLGGLPELAYRAHDASLEMVSQIESVARPGVATAELYELCVKIAKREGLEEYFMGYSQQSGFVGHGVGLEINELPVLAPRSKETLEEGNIFAIEPKFVLPRVGAVGIENTYVVNGGGVENLTVLEQGIVEL